MNAHWTDRLSEYIDGDLTADERRACEAHLAACAVCRAEADDLRAFVHDTPRLLNDSLPSHDLWPGVAEHLGTLGTRAPQHPGTRAPGHPGTRVSFTLPQLALAASLLMAVSSGVMYLVMTRPAAIVAVAEPAVQGQVEGAAPDPRMISPANFADAQYDAAVSDLERILEEQRGALDPRTVLILERNLAAIDQAIREARAALDADPANPYLNSHLTDARRRKLDLLRRATAIVSETGGN